MAASKVITFFMVLLSELAAKKLYPYTSICLDLLLNQNMWVGSIPVDPK